MKREFSAAMISPSGDCGKWCAEIDHNICRQGFIGSWYGRILAYGADEEDARALRERILDAINSKVPDEPAEWDGQGLPPIGVRIEARHKAAQADWARPDFYETMIVAMGKQLVIFEEDGSGHEKVGKLSDYLFRPARTPEQIAAEEREKAIEQMISDTNILVGTMGNRRLMAAQLYDAGYRKQVPPCA